MMSATFHLICWCYNISIIPILKESSDFVDISVSGATPSPLSSLSQTTASIHAQAICRYLLEMLFNLYVGRMLSQLVNYFSIICGGLSTNRKVDWSIPSFHSLYVEVSLSKLLNLEFPPI